MTFKIPEFEYFDMGGRCSGNKRGSALDDFNFLLAPESGRLTARVWYGVKCFDLSEPAAETEFDLTREGYRAALDWLEEQFSHWREEHSELDRETGYFTK